MRIAYFDCFSGAAGDMILGAIVAAGLDAEALRGDLAHLNLTGYTLDIRPVKKQGFAAIKVDVRVQGDQGHRHLHHITRIIDAAGLPEVVKERSKRVFTRLAEAEAKIHGTTVEKVHFHEVGAVDAIVDVVGSVAGLHRLGVDRVMCSPIPTGHGTVTCQHGVMPVPAPATAELLVGVPLAACDEEGELTTPTGAALLTTLAAGFGPLPPMVIEKTGFAAGTRDGKRRPNVLRLILGQAVTGPDEMDEVVLLEANLDDATGEEIGHATGQLFAAGALDVFTTPIQMKKGRPGVLLSVLSPIEREGACETVLLRDTSTFGLRRTLCTRRKLERRHETVATPFGEIRLKLGLRQGEVLKAAPEYDDCSRAAQAHQVGLRTVMEAALEAWRTRQRTDSR